MKNIYSILSLCLILMSMSVFGQTRVYAPSLVEPSDMDDEQMPDVVLDWDAVTGTAPVILYELQLADNPDFTGATTFEKTDLTAMTMSDLLFAVTYYWRVRAYSGTDVSDWSEEWSFTVIEVVDMKKPNNGKEVFVNPLITWDEMTGVVGFIMEVDTNDTFSSSYMATYDIPGDSSSWQLFNLLFGEDFFYRVKAYHNADTSEWSEVKSLFTQAAPELDDPSDGSVTDLYVKFSWDEYEGTTNYVFEIDTDETFPMPRAFAPDPDTLWVNDLVFGEQYYWRVAAQHALDISYWSEVWTFNTVNNITLISPENGFEEANHCPLFEWEEVAGTSGYELWVDTDESFSDPNIHQGTDAHYQCQTNLEYNTVYYWKVRGISGPLMSEWSETWTFRTEKGIGIDEKIIAESVSVYPNPTNGAFNLSVKATETATYELRVVDITGKLIYQSEIELQAGNNTLPITIDNIVSGSYNLIITDGSEVLSNRLVIK